MKETVELQVKGMSCEHCKTAVEGALKAIDGIESATVNLDKNTVAVTFDPVKVDFDHFTEAIDEAGYELIGQV